MKKITVNVTFTRTYNCDEDSTKSLACDFLCDAVNEASADDNMKICENHDNKTLSLVQNRGRIVNEFSFTDFADFLEKYGKFINAYDVARVFNVYARADKISASIEEIPDETKNENPAS